MSDKTIRAGDLVMVVGNALDMLCEHVTNHIGKPLDVVAVADVDTLACKQCGRVWRNVECALFMRPDPFAMRTSWLLKIDPPALTDTTTHDEQLTVPA